eukprot:TRINITY_DN2458_c0_g3_i1.p1 TRINITY_DN2458_c0_g3~~TRINITY_DN2458_c0_g3_i1.p1  ORF type:complete len:673 (-),score=61.04 TRINITY_DN2458_c0_g3_i1:234-2252(-)
MASYSREIGGSTKWRCVIQFFHWPLHRNAATRAWHFSSFSSTALKLVGQPKRSSVGCGDAAMATSIGHSHRVITSKVTYSSKTALDGCVTSPQAEGLIRVVAGSMQDSEHDLVLVEDLRDLHPKLSAASFPLSSTLSSSFSAAFSRIAMSSNVMSLPLRSFSTSPCCSRSIPSSLCLSTSLCASSFVPSSFSSASTPHLYSSSVHSSFPLPACTSSSAFCISPSLARASSSTSSLSSFLASSSLAPPSSSLPMLSLLSMASLSTSSLSTPSSLPAESSSSLVSSIPLSTPSVLSPRVSPLSVPLPSLSSPSPSSTSPSSTRRIDKGVEASLAEIALKMPEVRECSIGYANMRMLLKIGATEKQAMILWRERKSWFQKEDRHVEMVSKMELLQSAGYSTELFFHMMTCNLRFGNHKLLTVSSDVLAQRVRSIQNVVGQDDLSRCGTSLSQLLSLSSTKFESNASHISSLGISVKQVIFNTPTALVRSSETLSNKIKCLAKLIQVDDAVMIVTRYPRLLLWSVELVAENFAALEKRFGTDWAKQLVKRFPNTLTLNQASVAKFVDNFVNFFGREEALALIKAQPTLLGFSWEDNTLPKLRFFMDVMKYGKEDILLCPSALGYSLENRVRPRYEALVAKGLWAVSRWPLGSVVCPTDATFAARFEARFEKETSGA